jgi:hypothetical protein
MVKVQSPYLQLVYHMIFLADLDVLEYLRQKVHDDPRLIIIEPVPYLYLVEELPSDPVPILNMCFPHYPFRVDQYINSVQNP